MLTIRVCKAFSKALGEYLRQADYYAEGMKVEGACYGRLCQAVGLAPGKPITDEAFARVASNHHGVTGEQLTERMKDGRRAGYDAVFNAPKSVSIQAFVGGDERLLIAHEKAVNEALRELERFACHQEGQGIDKRHVASGAIAAAVFRHGESRALDPHLHSHAFVFNVTRSSSDSKRLLALESSAIFENSRYLTEVYRNILAAEVQQLGYRIERREHGFELAGISSNLLERFSKRARERDVAISAREAELDRELTRDEIALLVRDNRAEKQYALTPEQVRGQQLAQVSESELKQLHRLRHYANGRLRLQPISLSQAIAQAVEHLLERRTVVSLNEMTAEIIRQDYGAHSPEVIKALIMRRHGGLLHADDKVTTQAALDREHALIKKIDAGVGSHAALGFLPSIKLTGLGAEQKSAVQQIFESRDAVTVLRGKAGTGKTHTLATTIEGLSRSGQAVVCFAPSTHAVALLQRDGAEQRQTGYTFAARALGQTSTVQRLLVDPKLQATIAGKVVIVDEYGLLSVRQLQELIDVASARRARLLLVGDSGQHKSVEAGDAARIIEKETRVKVAELREVRRQAVNPAYRAAAEALAAGRLLEALGKLDQMGAVVGIDNLTARRVRMVEEWHAVAQETKVVRTKAGGQERAKTSLMVAPTWAEIDALNAHAREKLRKAGKIFGEDQIFVSLRAKDWTKAQQKDVRNYQPGDILVAHMATKHFAKGDELRVVRQEQRRLVVACHGQEVSVSPRQSGLAWTVCEERPLAIAAGDQVRLRAIAQASSIGGRSQRLANGTTVTVKTLDASGQLVLADGSTLRTRQVVHGYAMTSHAAQGLTVDKVFVAGAVSHEGLYVSTTRGHEGIRVFVPDRAAFLTAVGLRSEARMSATEFVRQHRIQTGLRATLKRGWRHLQWMRARVIGRITPLSQPESPAEAVSAREATVESPRLKPRIHDSVFISGQGPADDSPSSTPAHGPRMRV